MQHFLQVSVCLSSLLLAVLAIQSKSDEARPYEFGFTVDGQQHRHEKKDENGIIQGEFGFITADGIYHVTVYATDENGNFKILSMRNVRVSAPLDGSPGPSGPLSPQPGAPQTRPLAPSTLKPITTTRLSPLQTTTRLPPIPTTTKSSFSLHPTIGVGCAGCHLVTPPTKPFAFQTQFNPGNKPQTQFNPGNKPQSQFNPENIPQTQFNPGNKPQTQFNPGNNPQTQFNQNYPNNNQNNEIPGVNTFQNPGSNQGFQNQNNLNGQNNVIGTQGPNSNYPSNDRFPVGPGGNPALLGGPVRPPGSVFPAGLNEISPQKPLQPINNPLPPVQVTNNAITVQSNPQVTIPIKDKLPGMSNGLPNGVQEKDITDLLYKFKYTVGFHGHYEKGLKNGGKIGGYFVNGRDGISRVVTYIADENGYRPKFKFVRLGLDSDETPKEGSEKTFGLKSFEFVWYPVN